ncbi:flagellar capping protein [compost metagenome]
MYIQANLPRNPYATLALMTRQGAMGEDHGPLARKPLPGLANAAPALRSQLLARVERYEGLGEQIASLRSALNQFTAPAMGGAARPLSHGSAALAQRTTNAPSSGSGSSGPSGSSGASESSGTSGASGPSSGTTPVSGSPSPSSTQTVLSPAVMLATHAIFLASGTEGTVGTPATQARLVTDAVSLNPNALTTSTHEGGKIQLNNKGQTTDFGAVTINGVRTVIGEYKGTSEEDAAHFVAKAINDNAKNQVIASVDPKHGNRLVLTAKVAGSAGSITIDDIEEGTTKKGSTGLDKGKPTPGTTGETDLGEVTINGITTRFGKQRFASAQDATRYMVDRLNADHAGKLVASVGGENGDRLVLTSVAHGHGAVIAIDAVKASSDKSSENNGINGFTVGIKAQGRDAEAGTPGDPGFTDFGRITINGIETEFGLLDNRTHTAETAARYLAELINQSNSTVRASIDQGRLMLVSTESGADARIRIDAVASDTDGNRGNDRALGFVAGAQASGRETTETEGGGGSGPSVGSGSSTSGGSQVDGSETGTSGSGGHGERAIGSEVADADLQDQVREWMRLTNGYLGTLNERSHEHPQGDLQAFGRSIGAMLRDPQLSAVGLKVEKGRLALDEETFTQALERDPQVVQDAMQQFRETLDPLLASQAYAMSFMREVAAATRDRATEISQALTMRYRLEERSKEVSGWLESLEKLLPDLTEQSERLSKLEAGEAEDAEDEAEETQTPSAARTPETSPWLKTSQPTRSGFWNTREDRP